MKKLLNFVQEDHGLIKQFYQNLHGPIFEEFFFTVRQYRCDIVCGLYSYNKQNDNSTDATNFGGVIHLPEYYTMNNHVYLCVIINFIDTWLNTLTNNCVWCCCAYQNNMKNYLNKFLLKNKLLLLNNSRENVRHSLLIFVGFPIEGGWLKTNFNTR